MLAGGIAHDFNNLLSGIYGYIELAREKTESGEAAGYLEGTLDTIERTRKLTQQLLTFAKGGEPEKRGNEIVPLIKETVSFALSGSNISPEYDIIDDSWAGFFDSSQISRVIENIVINAKQAMPEGGVIRISVDNRERRGQNPEGLAPGKYIVMIFEDQGAGMDEAVLGRIFDPFYTTKATGNGLGLATCYSILQRHGGSIEAKSEPGAGSAFTVYLPAIERESVAPGAGDSAAHKGRGTFVVMDDEEIVCRTLGGFLSSMGYAVRIFGDGRSAVEFILGETERNRNVAGAIFDLTIPAGMGGEDVVRELRKMSLDIPVLVSSGYAENPVMSCPGKYGFDESLRKPFRRKELVEALNRVMAP